MIGIKKTAAYLAFFAAIGLFAAPVFADLLSSGTAYYDGVNTWKGTTPFVSVDEPNLNGYVNWIVYGPGDFPFANYTPTPGELTYVYQVFNTGSAAISNYSVYLVNSADNVGSFSDSGNGVTGDVPTFKGLVPLGSAWWDFAGIAEDGNSQGLVYSSPKKPQDFYSVVINHGQFARPEPVPSPSSNSIPEPATLLSLLIALGVVAVTMASRQLRRR